jgi:rod shape-determining protein MreD
VNRYLSIPVLVLAALLQATFVPQIRFGGAAPDLVYLAVLCWAIGAELSDGLWWAFIGGVLHDLLSAAPLGVSSVGLCLIVFGIGGLNRQMFGSGWLLLAVVVVFGSAVQQLSFMLLMFLVGGVPQFTIALPDDLLYVVLPSMAYNFLLVWPIYALLRPIQWRIERRRA